MLYAQLINGELKMAPNPAVVDSFLVCNPTKQQYAKINYLPVVRTPYPEDVQEGYTAISHWEEKKSEICETWEIVSIPEPTPTPVVPTLEERVEVLEGENREVKSMIKILTEA